MYGRAAAQAMENEELERLKQIYMEKELKFIEELENSGYKRQEIESDGNCLFSALGNQKFFKGKK